MIKKILLKLAQKINQHYNIKTSLNYGDFFTYGDKIFYIYKICHSKEIGYIEKLEIEALERGYQQKK